MKKPLEELELRLAAVEGFLDQVKQSARSESSPEGRPPGLRELAARVERIEQALVANFNVNVREP